MRENANAVENADEIFRLMVSDRLWRGTMIVCFFTGVDLPSHCAPMARQPAGDTGIAFDSGFPAVFRKTIKRNPAIHDGAVMVGRDRIGEAYKIAGWSFRLFPENGVASAPANRGSAFNSALAMSWTSTIDAVYWISGRSIYRFCGGRAFELASER